MLDSAANCGMTAQRHKGVDDEVGGFRCSRWVGHNQKISQAVKVAPGAQRCQLQSLRVINVSANCDTVCRLPVVADRKLTHL